MLSALLNRLRPKGPPPSESPPRRAAPSRHAPPAPATAIGARRPLVSAQGKVAGFEFHAGEALMARLDGAAAAAYAANLLGAMRLCVGQGLSALSELPASWLHADPDGQPLAPGMYLLLRGDAARIDPAATGALVARLRSAGVHVGWDPLADHALPGPVGLPDFVPLRLADGLDAAAVRAAALAASTRWPGTPLLLDLPSVDLLDALGPPVLWATFAAGRCTEPPRAQTLPPQARHMLRLLNRLLRDDAHAAVVDDIKADAALGLRLLQYLNSVGAAQGRELDSIEQAVLLLGRDALYRWVAQMVVRMAPPRPAVHALQATALARARLFERLANEGGEPNPGGLYLLGLATMLPLLLQCSLDEAMQAMQLPAPATRALRQQGGPWQPYLTLLQALESTEPAAIDDAAAPFGGRQAVLTAWADAWQSDAAHAPLQ